MRWRTKIIVLLAWLPSLVPAQRPFTSNDYDDRSLEQAVRTSGGKQRQLSATSRGRETTAQPATILQQINEHNEDGSYTYGYEGSDGSFKLETRFPNGAVKGRYGYIDSDTGKLKIIEYGADAMGFQPEGDLPEGIIVPPPVFNNDSIEDEQDFSQQQLAPSPTVQIKNRARGAPRPALPPSQNRGQVFEQHGPFESSRPTQNNALTESTLRSAAVAPRSRPNPESLAFDNATPRPLPEQQASFQNFETRPRQFHNVVPKAQSFPAFELSHRPETQESPARVKSQPESVPSSQIFDPRLRPEPQEFPARVKSQPESVPSSQIFDPRLRPEPQEFPARVKSQPDSPPASQIFDPRLRPESQDFDHKLKLQQHQLPVQNFNTQQRPDSQDVSFRPNHQHSSFDSRQRPEPQSFDQARPDSILPQNFNARPRPESQEQIRTKPLHDNQPFLGFQPGSEHSGFSAQFEPQPFQSLGTASGEESHDFGFRSSDSQNEAQTFHMFEDRARPQTIQQPHESSQNINKKNRVQLEQTFAARPALQSVPRSQFQESGLNASPLDNVPSNPNRARTRRPDASVRGASVAVKGSRPRPEEALDPIRAAPAVPITAFQQPDFGFNLGDHAAAALPPIPKFSPATAPPVSAAEPPHSPTAVRSSVARPTPARDPALNGFTNEHSTFSNFPVVNAGLTSGPGPATLFQSGRGFEPQPDPASFQLREPIRRPSHPAISFDNVVQEFESRGPSAPSSAFQFNAQPAVPEGGFFL